MQKQSLIYSYTLVPVIAVAIDPMNTDNHVEAHLKPLAHSDHYY